MLAIATVPAAAQAATKTVDMGTPVSVQKTLQKQSVDVNDFFPHKVTIHAGDSVRFVPTGFHNLDLPKKGGKPSAFAGPTGQKIADAKDAAGNPFWFNGQDAIGINGALIKSFFGKKLTYSGAKAVGSGLPLASKPKPLSVKFTKAGTFTYFCDIHPGMKGVVKVVGKGKAIPSAAADAKALKAQIARDVATAKTLKSAKPPANTVYVGSAGAGGVEYFGMVPDTLDVPVGTTLTFTMTKKSVEGHTATTGPGDADKEPNSYLGKLAKSFESPVFDPAAVYPSDPPPATAGLSPSSHGNGFWNTGLIDEDPASPSPAAGSVRLDAPGTYKFFCLIHTNMVATVTVR